MTRSSLCIAIAAVLGVLSVATTSFGSPAGDEIDAASWDEVLLIDVAQDPVGASAAEFNQGLPAGVAEAWLLSAQARALIKRHGQRWVLTHAGRQRYQEVLAATSDSITVGLDEDE